MSGKITSIHVEFAETFYAIKVLIALSILNPVTNAAEDVVTVPYSGFKQVVEMVVQSDRVRSFIRLCLFQT